MSNVPINKNDSWNPYFYKNFVGFSSIVPFWAEVASQFLLGWPSIADFNDLRSEGDLAFILQQSGMVYEAQIYLKRQVPTRLNVWHDFFNNLTWLVFPRTKWAMITRSMQEKRGAQRTSRQNLLAHFDECGMVLCSVQPDYFKMVKQHQWKALFWEARDLIQQAEPFIVGHGLLQKGLAPYIGMTGKVILMTVLPHFFSLSAVEKLAYIDQKLAHYILSEAFPNLPKSLDPFPLLGWPGWHQDNRCAEFYDNHDYFRP